MHTRSTRIGASDHLDQWLDRLVGLRIDVDPDVGPRAEDVLEQRDRFATVDQRPRHLGPGQLADDAGPVGDSIELVVVEGHEHAVGGDVDVGLEVADTRGRPRVGRPAGCSRVPRMHRHGGRRGSGRGGRGTGTTASRADGSVSRCPRRPAGPSGRPSTSPMAVGGLVTERRVQVAAVATTLVGTLPVLLTGALAVQIGRDVPFGPTRIGIASGVFFGAAATGSALDGPSRRAHRTGTCDALSGDRVGGGHGGDLDRVRAIRRSSACSSSPATATPSPRWDRTCWSPRRSRPAARDGRWRSSRPASRRGRCSAVWPCRSSV